MFTSDVIKARMCTLSVSNVIYHKFSYEAAFYTLNGKNVNVMLEFFITFTETAFVTLEKAFYTGVNS